MTGCCRLPAAWLFGWLRPIPCVCADFVPAVASEASPAAPTDEAEARETAEITCPGAESDRRHGDFQSPINQQETKEKEP